MVKTPTFLSLKQSDLSTNEKQNLHDVLGLLFVLVSAGTELTLFLVAGTMLCFGFSVRTMLIATTKTSVC